MHPAFAFVYAGLLIIGGVIGFAKSGSVISAVAGVGSGLAIAGVEVAKTSLPSQRTALCATHAVIALMLTFTMYTRWKVGGQHWLTRVHSRHTTHTPLMLCHRLPASSCLQDSSWFSVASCLLSLLSPCNPQRARLMLQRSPSELHSWHAPASNAHCIRGSIAAHTCTPAAARLLHWPALRQGAHLPCRQCTVGHLPPTAKVGNTDARDLPCGQPL